ncbi:MAG: tail fiber protein [Flavobacteriales bacterium]
MDEQFIGQIILFAGNFAPRGWAFCDGQLLSISQNQALFSIIGTAYGGDGRTTFGLPDLRGRTPVHAGSGPGLTSRARGQSFGTETNTMTIDQMPDHNHSATGSGGTIGGSVTATLSGAPGVRMNVSNDQDSETPDGKFLGKSDSGLLYNGSPTAGEQLAASAIVADLGNLSVSVDTSGLSVNLTGVTIGNAGGHQPMNNMQPSLAINYIIALQGQFPTRS